MKIAGFALCVALLLGGCSSHAADTPENVKKGILRDLAKSINVDQMEVSVDSVAFRDKEADATVAFWPKGGSHDQSVSMKYVMEKRADEWYIKSRASVHMDAKPGAAGEMPAGHPAMGNGAEMPAGHPAVGGQTK